MRESLNLFAFILNLIYMSGSFLNTMLKPKNSFSKTLEAMKNCIEQQKPKPRDLIQLFCDKA